MRGWTSVAAIVLVYDAWAAATRRPTLSTQFRRASEQHPLTLASSTAYLVMHLWGWWPRRVDPFCGFCWLVGALALIGSERQDATDFPKL